MILSREAEKRVTKIVEAWGVNTCQWWIATPQDRKELVADIIKEFYPHILSCGHRVRDVSEGVVATWQEAGGEKQANVCADCAKEDK